MTSNQLNYNQKLVGLALLKIMNVEDAVPAFADVIKLSYCEAKGVLLNLQKHHLLLVWGIIEKHDGSFFIYESYVGKRTIDQEYLNSCPPAKSTSLQNSMQMLLERIK